MSWIKLKKNIYTPTKKRGSIDQNKNAYWHLRTWTLSTVICNLWGWASGWDRVWASLPCVEPSLISRYVEISLRPSEFPTTHVYQPECSEDIWWGWGYDGTSEMVLSCTVASVQRVYTQTWRRKDQARKELSDILGALTRFLACLSLLRHRIVTQKLYIGKWMRNIESTWFRPLTMTMWLSTSVPWCNQKLQPGSWVYMIKKSW